MNTSDVIYGEHDTSGHEAQAVKQPKTYEQQVEIINSKGFVVNNDTECIEFLEQTNYYRLSAYFLPFRKKDGTYFENINFNRIQRIYEFDSRLRGLLFNCIERIELYLRTQLAHYSGHIYGALGYIDENNYNEKHNHEKFMKLLNMCIEENKNTLVVKHHKEKYNGAFPIWVIIEFFSMGMLSYFYADLQSAIQKSIAKEVYGASVACLKSWLRCVTDLRNRCAHYSTLYYWSFTALPKMPRGFDTPQNRKLFSQVLVLKLLYPDNKEWNSKIMIELRAVMEEYEADISLKHIGFPQNWYEQLQQ